MTSENLQLPSTIPAAEYQLIRTQRRSVDAVNLFSRVLEASANHQALLIPHATVATLRVLAGKRGYLTTARRVKGHPKFAYAMVIKKGGVA